MLQAALNGEHDAQSVRLVPVTVGFAANRDTGERLRPAAGLSEAAEASHFVLTFEAIEEIHRRPRCARAAPRASC